MYRHRSKVIFFRGYVPCDVLFIGEAPGMTEDILGQPFTGPAGRMLDELIGLLFPPYRYSDGHTLYGISPIETKQRLTWCCTNVVCCIPKPVDKDNQPLRGIREPTDKEIRACHDRLLDFIHIAQPTMCILLGQHAAKHAPDPGQLPPGCHTITAVHPAFIMRLPEEKQFTSFKRWLLTIHKEMQRIFQ